MVRILEKIIDGLPEGDLTDIRIGSHWTAVAVGVDEKASCGLASNPIKNMDSDLVRNEISDLRRSYKRANDLCELVFHHDSFVASIGMAAINALLPHDFGNFTEYNAGAAIAHYGHGKRVALVGHFPFVPELRERVGELDVLELNPREGDLPAAEACHVIPKCQVVAITSMTFINGTIDELLQLCSPESIVMVIGPSTPLSPVLFDYGIDLLCGSIVENIPLVLEGVDAGESFRQLQHRGIRLVTLAKDLSV